MTLERMLEIAKAGGSVRWSDGTVTKVTLEDSHLFGMVLCKHLPGGGAEPLDLANTYDADEPGSGGDAG